MADVGAKNTPVTVSKSEQGNVINIPEGSNVRIRVDSDSVDSVRAEPVKKKDMSERSLWAIVSGGVAAVAGYIGSHIYVERQMFDFNNEVASKTKNSITGRGGIGAGLAEGSAGLGGIGVGTAGHAIADGHARELVAKGEHKFASFIYRNFGGNHGWIPLTTAAVAGLTAAGLYLSTHPKKAVAEQEPKDWKDKIADEPVKAITRE